MYYEQLSERSDDVCEGYLSFVFCLLRMFVFDYFVQVTEINDLVQLESFYELESVLLVDDPAINVLLETKDSVFV